MPCDYHIHNGLGDCPICLKAKNRKVARDMKAPTEQQLKDPAWWDENAPQGCTKAGAGYVGNVIWSFEFMPEGVTAVCAPCNAEVRFIERPTKPEPKDIHLNSVVCGEHGLYFGLTACPGCAKGNPEHADNLEWDGKGEIPIPCRCEVRHATDPSKWFECDVVAKRDGYIWWRPDTNDIGREPYKEMFRPIRTQAEREREETIEAARLATSMTASEQDLLETLYDAGMLRKGE